MVAAEITASVARTVAARSAAAAAARTAEARPTRAAAAETNAAVERRDRRERWYKQRPQQTH